MNVLTRLLCLISLVSRLKAAVEDMASEEITKVSEDYQVLLSDTTIEANTSGGAVILTLPDATSASGMRKTFKRVPGSGEDVTIMTSGTDTIDADTTFILSNDWSSVTFRAAPGDNPGDPGIWLITASYNT